MTSATARPRRIIGFQGSIVSISGTNQPQQPLWNESAPVTDPTKDLL
jgi:hypothetical protein